MQAAASRIMNVGKASAESQPASSIFGSAAGLASSIERDEEYRVSIYPIVSESRPDEAMGLAANLGHLLDQYRELKVYHIVARIDPDDDSDEISQKDYQFSPEEWELEGLDDNVVVYGQLTQVDSELALQIHLDKSLAGAEDETRFNYRGDSLAGLVNLLPSAAEELATAIAGDGPPQLILGYPPVDDSHELSQLLEAGFGWNLDLYLHHWDVPWTHDAIREQFFEMVDICRRWPNGYSYWGLGMAARQVLQLGLEDIGEAVLPLLEEAFDAGSPQAFGAAAAALGLGNLGYDDRALRLMQRYLSGTRHASIWMVAIDLQEGAGRIADAIDLCQSAIENGVEDAALFWRYADLLESAEAQDLRVEDVLFVDPDAVPEEEQLAWEAISALESCLRIERGRVDVLQRLVVSLIEMEDESLWEYFALLIEADPEASTIVDLLERIADLDDLEPAYDMLQSTVNDENRPFVLANLAQLAILDERYDRAGEYVEEARRDLSADNNDLEAELQRLGLAARSPGFEARFAEIKMTLNANGQIAEKDVDLLEEAIDLAPKLIDPYITLARIYLNRKDYESAVEVLSEAKDQVGEHPQISLSLAQMLWQRQQRSEAVQELNTGAAAFPNDVKLLAQLASYLIDNGQLEDARQYVERVERIAPMSRLAAQLRQLIALKLSD